MALGLYLTVSNANTSHAWPDCYFHTRIFFAQGAYNESDKASAGK